MYNKFFEELNLKPHYEFEKIRDIFVCTLKLQNIPFSSYGKGFSKEEAKLSSEGEMAERILTRNFFEEYFIDNLYPDAKKVDFLNEELKEFYNISSLEKEELIDFNSSDFDILSIPFISRSNKEKVYFPINLIQNLYASNGMAAHFDIIKAYQNAKAEIIERFVKFEVIKYALPLPKISHSLNSKNIQLYDASLGGKYPVIAASFIEEDNIILSFGCDIDKEKAIQKAYLELLQTGLNSFGKIVNNIEEVRERFNLIAHFTTLNGDVHKNFLKKPLFKEAEWNFLNYEVFNKEEYFRIYKCCGVFAVSLIIPGISEIYPKEDLIYNNINYPKFFRDKILNYQNYSKEEIKDLIEEISYLYPLNPLDSLIGVITKEPLFLEKFEEIINKNEKIELSKKYLAILELAKKLGEKNEV